MTWMVPWSLHTTCCLSCVPCWSWSLFTTHLRSCRSFFMVRDLVSYSSFLTNCWILLIYFIIHGICFYCQVLSDICLFCFVLFCARLVLIFYFFQKMLDKTVKLVHIDLSYAVCFRQNPKFHFLCLMLHSHHFPLDCGTLLLKPLQN